MELHGVGCWCTDCTGGEAEIVRDFANADVGGVADVEVALVIERYAHAVAAVGADDGLGADAGVADGGCGAAVCDAASGDDVGEAGAAILKPDDVVGGVGDVEVAVGVHGEFLRGHVDGVGESGCQGRVGGAAGSGDGVDVAVDG